MKAFIFNDTRFDNHHGCSMVMSAIFHALRLRKVVILATSPVGYNWQRDELILENLSRSDVIIVNGEGSIHHNNPNAYLLAEVAEYCRKIQKPCHLINAVFDSNSLEIANKVRNFDSIYVREDLSKQELRTFNIDSKVVPDLSFYWNCTNQNNRSKKIGVTDSVGTNELNCILYSRAMLADAVYLPILTHPFPVIKTSIRAWLIFLRYLFRYNAFWIVKTSKAMSLENKKRYFYTSNSSEYMAKIASCKALLTGRFHGLCIAIITNTPFLATKLISHKIEGLLMDIGIGLDRLISESDLEVKAKLEIPDFSKKELDKILNYSANAKTKIDGMFDSIFVSN